MSVDSRSGQFAKVVRFGLAPATFFLACFIILTWPAITRFQTHFFADQGDGLQNVWNIWWIERATLVLHQNPWHTTYLRYPYGTTLVGHTLNPFNGFSAVGLSPFMSLVASHNTLVTFSFVAGGVTAFLLAYELSAAYWPSLIAGYIFTFSSFHFAHAEGHLQMVSLEWIPLFLLLWLRLVATPTIGRSIAAALTLFLVILCDYYYFLYCVIAAVIVLAWRCVRDGSLVALVNRHHLIVVGTFVAVTLATSGVLAGALLWSNLHDPLTRTHAAAEYSLDLLAPFIYGGHWRFASLTESYWVRLPGNRHETSVHVGFSVIVLLLYAWAHRDARNAPTLGLFSFLLMFFLLAALGPTLQIAGKDIGSWPILPYAVLQFLLPPLALSGVPVRMMVMVMLSAAVICAFALARLYEGSRKEKRFAAAVICLLAIEYLPAPIPTTQPPIPGYVLSLRDLPADGGILDTVSQPSLGLLYQTIHEKPLALGYPVARLPQSVAMKDRALENLIQHDRFERLWPDYRIKYVVAAGSTRESLSRAGARTIWTDGRSAVVDVSQVQ